MVLCKFSFVSNPCVTLFLFPKALHFKRIYFLCGITTSKLFSVKIRCFSSVITNSNFSHWVLEDFQNEVIFIYLS